MKQYIFISLSVLASLVFQSNPAFSVEFHSLEGLDPTQFDSNNAAVTFPPEWDGITSGVCSGALIRLGNDLNAKALILSNGHCYGPNPPGVVLQNLPLHQRVTIFTNTGSTQNFILTRLVFSTETKTDVAVVEMNETYAQLESQGIHAFTLATKSAAIGDAITLISGYHRKAQACTIASIVHELREDRAILFNSYRYDTCKSVPGWSGTPIIAKGTRIIVGINNTHYSGGVACTDDNPCEVDEGGKITVGPNGTSYGQQTALILSCVDSKGLVDLQLPTCALTKQ